MTRVKVTANIIKAKAVYEKYKIPVLADDSGLEVDYLNKIQDFFYIFERLVLFQNKPKIYRLNKSYK